MRELSLFSGCGGGVWGSKLLGWRTVGYVEVEQYNQEVIAQRIKEKNFEDAPIFGDIRAFINNGYASAYKGMVDIITAGFPCPAFSHARHAHVTESPEDNEKNLWPETIECIRQIGPRYLLLENVPGLLTDPYFGRILSDLAQAGYDARWGVFGVDDCGGEHIRKRLWIRCELSNTSSKGLQGREEGGDYGESWPWRSELFERLDKRDVWSHCEVEPALVGNDDGMADRCKRVRAIGNGQSPVCVAEAWRLLSEKP